jgi:hypothetical protein
MTAEKTFRAIPGGDALLGWFESLPTFRTEEGVPDFHDAEIVKLDLDRDEPGKLILRTSILGERQPVGHFARQKECTVTFTLIDVFDVELRGFSRQNVIGSLKISHREFSDSEMATLPGRSAGPGYEIHMEPCWGLSGTIRCRSLSITFTASDTSLIEKIYQPTKWLY